MYDTKQQRDYYEKHREHLKELSLKSYYNRKEIAKTDPKVEYERIMKLFINKLDEKERNK